MIINKTKLNILYNFVHLVDEQFWLHFFGRFQIPLQNFDFGLFKVKFEFEITKVQYYSYSKRHPHPNNDFKKFVTSGVYYKNFTIIIYDRNNSS
jgi:hypothetical protein